jgi:hypothetical protein
MPLEAGMVEDTLIFQLFRILLHSQGLVGGGEGLFGIELETGFGAVSISRCRHGNAKQQQNGSFESMIKHRLISNCTVSHRDGANGSDRHLR